MKTACVRSALVCGSVLSLSCFLIGVPRADSQSKSKTTAKMTESIVIPELGSKSECPECSTDTFQVSPDGIYLAHMQTDYKKSGVAGAGNTVEVRATQTEHIVATFRMPMPLYAASTTRYAVQTMDHLRYCDSGKYLLALNAYGTVYVLDTTTYQPHTIIDINYAPIHVTAIGQSRAGASLQVNCAANGNVVAFLVSGVTKVFNLDTGKEISLSDQTFSRPGIDEVVVSPSGDHVAILEDGGFVNGKFFGGGDWAIVVVDLQKETIRGRIALGGIDYNPFSPPVIFAGESMVAMMKPKVPMNNYGRESLHVWNVETGSEVQVINDLDPSADDVSYPGLSTDGRAVLVYTAKSRSKNGFKVKDVRFFLWDKESGRMIATSPSLKVIHHGCPIIQFIGKCMPSDETPVLTLSQSGNAVVAW